MKSDIMWTKEEEQYLVTNYNTKSYTEIAKFLGRSRDSVRGKIERLNIKKLNYVLPKAGEKYGRLLVIEQKGSDRYNYRLFTCLCDCGNYIDVPGVRLKDKQKMQVSCGCFSKDIHRKDAGETSFKTLYESSRSSIKARAKKIEFKLSFDEFKKLVVQNCFYCGKEPKYYNKYVKRDGSRPSQSLRMSPDGVDRAWIKANGLDRVDPDKDYCIENCVTCCFQCNIAKLDYTKDEFLTHIEKIYSYQCSKRK